MICLITQKVPFTLPAKQTIGSQNGSKVTSQEAFEIIQIRDNAGLYHPQRQNEEVGFWIDLEVGVDKICRKIGFKKKKMRERKSKIIPSFQPELKRQSCHLLNGENFGRSKFGVQVGQEEFSKQLQIEVCRSGKSSLEKS